MEFLHQIAMRLLTEPYVWILAVGTPLVAIIAAYRPIMVWKLNSQAFLEVVESLLRKGEEDRVLKLTQAAPRAHLAQLVGAWLEGGRVQFDKIREIQASRRVTQTFIITFAMVPAGGVAVLIHLGQRAGTLSWPLIVSCAISGLVSYGSMKALGSLHQDSKELEEEVLERLAAARTDTSSDVSEDEHVVW